MKPRKIGGSNETERICAYYIFNNKYDETSLLNIIQSWSRLMHNINLYQYIIQLENKHFVSFVAVELCKTCCKTQQDIVDNPRRNYRDKID